MAVTTWIGLSQDLSTPVLIVLEANNEQKKLQK